MKKAFSVCGYILFALIVLPPLLIIIFDCFGYTFSFFSYTFLALLTAAAAVTETVLSLIAKGREYSKTVSVLLSFSAPFLFISLLLYITESSTVIPSVCMFICFVCCCYLTLKRARPKTVKVISLVIFALLLHPFVCFTFFGVVLSDFGENIIVQTVPSPDNTYYAEVVDSDQGALGGDTIVDVYENSGFNAIVFKVTKSPKRIYRGAWGECENMEIYWKNENVLVINSAEYVVE